MRAKMRRIVAALLAVVVVFSVTVLSQRRMDSIRTKEFDEQLLYLPNEKLLTHFTVGMSSVVADILWLQCIQYTTTHFKSDHKFTWLDHMCRTIVKLDPYFADVYHFGGIFLAAVKGDDDASINLALKGIPNCPDRWVLPYDIAMVYLVNRRDQPGSPEQAAKYLSVAAATGGAPQYVTEIVEGLRAKHNLNDIERAMWLDMADSHPDQFMRDLAERKLQQMALRETCAQLNQVIETFKSRTGRVPRDLAELVSAGAVGALPQDPFGGAFFLDRDAVAQNTTLLDEAVTYFRNRLQYRVDSFKKEQGRWPDSLDELTSDGAPVFTHPYKDRQWKYDPQTGSVQ